MESRFKMRNGKRLSQGTIDCALLSAEATNAIGLSQPMEAFTKGNSRPIIISLSRIITKATDRTMVLHNA